MSYYHDPSILLFKFPFPTLILPPHRLFIPVHLPLVPALPPHKWKCSLLPQTKIGPVHLIINPFNALDSRDQMKPSYLKSIASQTLGKLFETQTPQMLILRLVKLRLSSRNHWDYLRIYFNVFQWREWQWEVAYSANFNERIDAFVVWKVSNRSGEGIRNKFSFWTHASYARAWKNSVYWDHLLVLCNWFISNVVSFICSISMPL